jgi:hypothetical protein
MKKIGLRFIGVVKTATRRFPMAYLQILELEKRGDPKGLIMRGGDQHHSLHSWGWIEIAVTLLQVHQVCKKVQPTVD